ncbi:MAG TPA: glutathione S-transferase family protein [Amaricoccus sp.]|nr:glutathione S-transferase family protein [Amaricoccus sp.]
MTLTLHYHPLASFCHKALIALDELGLGFEPVVVDLFDPDSRAAFARVWPLLKFPVLEDGARGATVGESTAIIEYLDAFQVRGHGGGMIPADPDLAWRARMWDRIIDQYVHVPMQKIVTDAIRPDGGRDPHGVAEARAGLAEAYRFLEAELPASPWALGADFGLADCAAAPALFYADVVQPLGPGEPRLKAYLDRLVRRPSYNRVLVAAAPFFPMFPLDPKPRLPA